MKKIPIIVGFGGINSAGRTSGFHSYKRIIHSFLSNKEMQSTWLDLANRMKIKQKKNYINKILKGTLIRKIDSFNPDAVIDYFNLAYSSESLPNIKFKISTFRLPSPIPSNWNLLKINKDIASIEIKNPKEILVPISKKLEVTTAGNIPKGFNPGSLYNSLYHPRSLQLGVYGISDAINSLGLDWENIMHYISPDKISVYAGSALCQSDENSLTGLSINSKIGKPINAKMIALSFSEMTADFINSYIINSVGNTGSNMGACATFLYNLRMGIQDIQLGKARVVIIGTSEAPISPEIIKGFSRMGALAKDKNSIKLNKNIDYSQICRPFSENFGFTISESAQFIIIMDDDLVMKIGANILGSVENVFINADGNKKSITSPGIGNYITIAKTVSLCKKIFGEKELNNTYVQSHGTGTPQNRVTESHILNTIAKAFSIKNWPVTAIKSYIGHSIASAAGDQISIALGVWKFKIIPGITSIDCIANDVHHDYLDILKNHKYLDKPPVAAIINSKGFGGNNASALLISPEKTIEMLKYKYQKNIWKEYQKKYIKILDKIQEIDKSSCEGKEKIIYNFGKSILSEKFLKLNTNQIYFSDSNLIIPY